jgi:hypothetical protein
MWRSLAVMTDNARIADSSLPAAAEADGDRSELEFIPLTPEELAQVGDRDYLFGTHTDTAIRA